MLEASGSVVTSLSTNSTPRSFKRFLVNRQGKQEGDVKTVGIEAPFEIWDVTTILSFEDKSGG